MINPSLQIDFILYGNKWKPWDAHNTRTSTFSFLKHILHNMDTNPVSITWEGRRQSPPSLLHHYYISKHLFLLLSVHSVVVPRHVTFHDTKTWKMARLVQHVVCHVSQPSQGPHLWLYDYLKRQKDGENLIHCSVVVSVQCTVCVAVLKKWELGKPYFWA